MGQQLPRGGINLLLLINPLLQVGRAKECLDLQVGSPIKLGQRSPGVENQKKRLNQGGGGFFFLPCQQTASWQRTFRMRESPKTGKGVRKRRHGVNVSHQMQGTWQSNPRTVVGEHYPNIGALFLQINSNRGRRRGQGRKEKRWWWSRWGKLSKRIEGAVNHCNIYLRLREESFQHL